MTDNAMPFIGDDNFAGPEDNSVRSDPTLPSKEGGDVQVEDLEAAVVSGLIPDSPEDIAAKYDLNLKEHKLSKTRARSMMEDLLVRGFFEEVIKLGPLDVVFRTRTDEHSRQLFRMMEAESFTLSTSVNDFVTRFNLAGSLARYGDKHFKHPDPMSDYSTAAVEEFEAEFDARFAFVTRLPQQVVSRLAHMLYEFDGRVAAVLGDGAPQNF